MKYFNTLKQRWSEPHGYKAIIHVAAPLVLSTGCWSIQQLMDGIFLSWYSTDALAASLPAGMISFSIVSFFFGTAAYVNTFVAQYYGANRYKRIGASIWQAIHFALFSQIVFLAIIPLARSIFAWSGHAPHLQSLERDYFSIVCAGSGILIYGNVLSCFFSGRSKTWTVMWVNITGTLVNVVMDYALIFGHFGFPAMGIRGAAYATVLCYLTIAVIYSLLIFLNKESRSQYAVLEGWKWEKKLFFRLMKYGIPNGVHFFLEVICFTFFIFFIGKIGTIELTATTMALQINNVVFLPLLGFALANSILVGQHLGKNAPQNAVRCTWSSFHLAFVYMLSISFFYWFYPALFIDPFAGNADLENFSKIRPLGIILLKFVAFYSIFDTMNLIFASVLKGAGDTRFVMYYSVTLGWIFLVLPTYFIANLGKGSFLTAWVFLSIYCIFIGIGFLLRFLQGKWKNMKVIENVALDAEAA